MNIGRIRELVWNVDKPWTVMSLEAGLSDTTIGMIVSGKLTTINLRTAFKLADYLGVDVNEFREVD